MYDKISNEINLKDIPVEALKCRTIGKLGCMLNKPKLIPSPSRLPRDYRGLADLMNISIIDGWLGNNPIDKLLKVCAAENKLTLGELQSYFEQIDRYDVLDDTAQMFYEDAVEFEKNKHRVVKFEPPLQPSDSEKNVLTLDDYIRLRRGDGPQMYDAFILYVEEDRPFAEEITYKMEHDFGLKICDKDRDLIAGLQFEHVAVTELISKRCNRVLVVLSKDFINSNRHTFFVKYAQAINFAEGKRKVVPLIYKQFDLPQEYLNYVRLDYETCKRFCNFWEKLYTSLVPIEFAEQLKFNNYESKGVVIEDVTLKEKNQSLKNSLKDIDASEESNSFKTSVTITSSSPAVDSNSKKNEKFFDKIDKKRSQTITKKIQLMLSGVKIRKKKPKKEKVACAV